MSLKTILIEGRVEDVFAKHIKSGSPSIEKIYYDEIVPGSENINPKHKYLEWITKNWSPTDVVGDEIKHNLKEILLAVSKFDNQSQRLKIKDLNQYQNLEQLFDTLQELGQTARRTVEISDEVEKVYEDNRFVVVVPKTHKSSCYYGAGTKWCTASKDTDSHFSSYKSGGELYYIIDKTLPTSNPFYKVALNKKLAGLTEDFWDVQDKPITDTTKIMSIIQNKKMLEDIRNHFGVKFEERIKQEKELQAKRLSRNEEFRERERLRRIQQGIEAQQRRENDEWSLENPTSIGLAAHALREWLIDEGEWEGETKDEFRDAIEDLRSRMENDPEVIEDPNGDKAQEYGEDLGNLEDDLENAESVYDIIPLYDYYGMYEFEYGGAEYAVGDDESADEAATERTRSLIDDIGYEGFTPSFMEWHVDGDQVADYAEDWFWDDMNDSPEDYLDDDDRELTQHSKDEIEKINEELGYLQEELDELDSEAEIEITQDRINELEERKVDIEIDDDSYEYTEEAKDNYVERRKSEVKDDPVNFLKDFGMEESIKDFIDEDDFIEAVIEADGRGHTLSSYDGYENEVSFDDEWYYIYRTN
tara:strand:- start:402 stop:2165 length:1764 start_codon:yes stop_codon:yes gene_type:complete